MRKYLKLEIPSSCHENWHTMLPEQQGRFCQSCQKKVIDFTHMSDKELTHFFIHAQGPLCGRFTHEQLNRNLLIPPKPLPWIKYFIQATLPAFLLSLKASALPAKVEYPIQQTPWQSALKDTSIRENTITVEGSIQDEQGNNIPHATIMLKGTKKGVMADSAGKFVFHHIQAPATLISSSVGYVSQEIVVLPEQKNLQLKLQMSAALMGEVVTVGYVAVSRKKKIARKSSPPENGKSQVLLYPNPLPVGSPLTIQCHQLEYGSYTLQLFNTSGVQVHAEKVAYTKGMRSIQVKVSTLSAGSYFLKLTHDKKPNSYTEQFIITL